MATVILSFEKIPIENLYLDDTVFVDPYADDSYVDDSLSWELIEPSDDESDKFSYHSSLDNYDDAHLDAEIKEDVDSPVVLPDSDVFMETLMEHIDLHRMYVSQPEIVVYDGVAIGGGNYDDDVDDDDNEEYDLDDELVPKWVNNRFERQRMRKLGKRVFPKMKNSKRLPLMYNKPGCVHGKHGLGLKHSLM